MSTKIHHPKSSMCYVCRKRDADCSELEFHKMPVMKKYSNENDPTVFVIVLCSGFDKE